MWSAKIMGSDFYHIFYFLLIYSILGWIWEVFYVFLNTDKLVNRGFLNGPLCPIYGIGATMVYLFLSPIADNLGFLYLGGVILPTVVEYITGAVMENLFHASWWDYSERKFNLKGRICLQVSLGWGIFSVVMIRAIHPIVFDLVEAIPYKIGIILARVAIVFIASDLLITVSHVAKFNEKLEKLGRAKDELRMRLENALIYETKEEILLKLKLSEKEYIEELKERIAKFKEANEEGIERIEQAFEETKERYSKYRNAIAKRNYVEKRLLTAFPKIKPLKNIDIFKEIMDKLNTK
ncbi:MAG: hypothetical protein VB018_15425 [Lachnospiraceae bacterium]|nr:hypothetical protein [Lachnospiraceae bacterium]